MASEASANTNTVESENFIFTRDGCDIGLFELGSSKGGCQTNNQDGLRGEKNSGRILRGDKAKQTGSGGWSCPLVANLVT